MMPFPSSFRPLAIDFVKPRPAASVPGLLLLVAGVAAISMVTADYLDAQDEHERIAAQVTRLEQHHKTRQSRASLADSSRKREEDKSITAKEQIAKNIIDRLNQPWDSVLGEIESITDPAISLLDIHGDARTRTLRITGEAREMADVVLYLNRLRDSSRFGLAWLSHHETVQDGAVRVIRFTLETVWEKPA